MATRTLWQDIYAIEQTATLTAKPTFAAATAIGIEGTGAAAGKFIVPLTDHPHLNPSSSINEQELAVGVSQRHHLEYNTTVAEPNSVTLNMQMNAYNLSLFIWLLFQTAAGEGDGTGNIKIMSAAPYTEADYEQYCAITRIMGGVSGADDTVSQYMVGCICNSLTITGESGGIMMLSAEMMGANWAVANDDLGAATWASLAFSDKAPLKFQDMNFELDNESVDIPSISITINANVAAQFYNNDTIQKYVLGRMNVEGNFGVPWGASSANQDENQQIQDFQNGVDKLFELWTGAGDADADNAVVIKGNIRYTDTEMADAEGEVVTNCTFAGVFDADENNSIEMYAGYDSTYLERGAPAATTTSTSSSTSSTTTS
jgi:hypothetical protein